MTCVRAQEWRSIEENTWEQLWVLRRQRASQRCGFAWWPHLATLLNDLEVWVVCILTFVTGPEQTCFGVKNLWLWLSHGKCAHDIDFSSLPEVQPWFEHETLEIDVLIHVISSAGKVDKHPSVFIWAHPSYRFRIGKHCQQSYTSSKPWDSTTFCLRHPAQMIFVSRESKFVVLIGIILRGCLWVTQRNCRFVFPFLRRAFFRDVLNPIEAPLLILGRRMKNGWCTFLQSASGDPNVRSFGRCRSMGSTKDFGVFFQRKFCSGFKTFSSLLEKSDKRPWRFHELARRKTIVSASGHNIPGLWFTGYRVHWVSLFSASFKFSWVWCWRTHPSRDSFICCVLCLKFICLRNFSSRERNGSQWNSSKGCVVPQETKSSKPTRRILFGNGTKGGKFCSLWAEKESSHR